jgi:hypothetical protein
MPSLKGAVLPAELTVNRPLSTAGFPPRPRKHRSRHHGPPPGRTIPPDLPRHDRSDRIHDDCDFVHRLPRESAGRATAAGASPRASPIFIHPSSYRHACPRPGVLAQGLSPGDHRSVAPSTARCIGSSRCWSKALGARTVRSPRSPPSRAPADAANYGLARSFKGPARPGHGLVHARDTRTKPIYIFGGTGMLLGVLGVLLSVLVLYQKFVARACGCTAIRCSSWR